MVNFVLVLIATLLLILLIVLCHLRVIPESHAQVMERLGVYSRTWHTGWHVKVPFVERPTKRVGLIDLREQILLVSEEQETHTLPVITKDNIKMGVDIVVFYQITDPRLFVYGHKNPIQAISHLTVTALRNLFGELELDAALTSRDTINSKMRVVLDEAADAWGIRITRVEIKDIVPPAGILEAMEAQMRAERQRRADVIKSEGIRKSLILEAEGAKQAEILRAEAEKHSTILIAEGQREAMICEGEGQAEAIILVEQAKAEGIKLVNAAEATQETLTLKSLESFAEAAKGESNTIIIPSEIQGIAGLAKSAAEVIKANPKSQADLEVEVK
jgi:regulator of protease activity HflC (stomatin/prohibitin superfamily)